MGGGRGKGRVAGVGRVGVGERAGWRWLGGWG